MSSPARRLTRSSALRSGASKPVANSSASKMTEVTMQTDAASEKGVLGKGKISFSFIKKRLQTSLVQYSDEDSAASEREDGEDRKEQSEAKRVQSAQKSSNLPPSVPKNLVEDIPVPHDSNKNLVPSVSKSQEQHCSPPKMCTRFTKQLFNKSRSDGSAKNTCVSLISAGNYKSGAKNTDVVSSVQTLRGSERAEVAEPAKSVDKMQNGRHSNMKYYDNVAAGILKSAVYKASDEVKENHSSLTLYEDTDNIEIKPVFVLPQTNDQSSDQTMHASDRDVVKEKEISSSSEECLTKTVCKNTGFGSSKQSGIQPSEHNELKLYDDTDNVEVKPAAEVQTPETVDTVKKHAGSPKSSESIISDRKLSENEREMQKLDHVDVQKGSKSENQSLSSQSSSSSSLSSSSSDSENEDSDSASSSTSSVPASEVGERDTGEQSTVLDTGEKDCAERKLNENPLDSSKLTADTVQPVQSTTEAASPYSPSKPTDEDTDPRPGLDVTEKADMEIEEQKMLDEKSSSTSSASESSSSGSSSSGSSSSSSESSDSESEMDSGNRNEGIQHDNDQSAHPVMEQPPDMTDASVKHTSPAHTSPESSHSTLRDVPVGHMSDRTKHLHDRHRTVSDSASTESIRHDYVTSSGEVISDTRTSYHDSTRSERVTEAAVAEKTQHPHHYTIPPNAPSWNLVEITSTSNSLREKPTQLSDLGRAERTEIPHYDKHMASHDRATQKEDYPEGRDRSHNRDRDQSSRGHDWGHDRYRDYARGRRHRDDEYEAKGGRDRDRDRHYDDRSRRYRQSKSREWDGRSKERRSRSRERERQSHSRERVKRSRSHEREHQSRSRERDRRSPSRDRKAVSRSRDRTRRSREREHRSRSRENETWAWHRVRDRRSRSRERRRSRDRYERDYRRRRKSSSRERDDHRRIDDRRDRHSSGHYRDDSRSHREREKVQRSSTLTALAAELESIPLPTPVQESEMYLPAEPVPIPTIPHSYAPSKQACFEHPAGHIIPDEVPVAAAPCQQRNLIYPPTVEMDNVSDIESVDMDVANSPNETKPSEEDKQKGNVHSIPVINQRSSSDEKAAARVAFSMKTVPKKSSLFRQVPGVFDDSGAASKRTQPDATPAQVYRISEAGSSFSSAAVSAIPLPAVPLSQPITEVTTEIGGRDASRCTVFAQETQPQSRFESKEVSIGHFAGSATDTQADGSRLSLTSRTEEAALSQDAGIQHADEAGLQRSKSHVNKDESQVTDTQQNDESGVPMTRRRSKRLRSLEERKDVKTEELPDAETKKQGGNSRMDEEEAGTKLHPENEGDSMVSQSEAREQFASPDSKDGIATKVRTPSPKPEKVKSRWRRWSELEASSTDSAPPPPPPPRRPSESSKPCEMTNLISDGTSVDDDEDGVPPPPPPPPVSSSSSLLSVATESITEDGSKEKLEPQEMPSLPEFEQITEHIYVSDRKKSKCRKEARRMVCDCVLPTKEEYLAGHKPCGDDCLNRMLFIECGSRCPCLDFCSNKRFQKRKYAKVEPFFAGAKGWGLKTKQKIEPGSFVMEYVGEVLDYREFRRRSKQYSRSNLKHFYFMALNADEVIDATQKGNISRFINHSCDPNCETQKWTVNGQLRIGFFAIRPLEPGEELTFDYQFESYGQAQKCYCGSENCRGYIGTTKKSPVKDSTNTSLKKEKRKIFNDVLLEEEINDMMELEGMRKRAHVLELARLMVRAESQEHRLALLKIIQDTKEPACLRLFLDYHGLSLLWSWMVDTTESSRELKVSLLKVLKQLPITNKTVLKESNILSVVERWSTEISEARKDDAKDEVSESSSSGRGTPVVSSKEVNQSAPTTPSYEGIPHKKRKLFQHLQQQDEPSSSDGDTASESGKKDGASAKEDTDSQTGDPDSKESESEIDTAQTDVEKVSGDWNSPLDSDKALPAVTDIANELISTWGNLKEVYKIPKICAQERKKTEQELDQRYGLDRHDLSTDKDLKRFAGGTTWSMGRDGKRRRLSSNKDGDSKSTKSKKILLPTPPEALLSKHERRALFEAQVKAQDELIYQQHIQQMSQYPQGYPYDPNSPYPDPNVAAQYPADPNISSYSGNPNVPGCPSDPNMASYPDPNMTFPTTQDSVYVDPGQAGTVNPVVPPQLIVQPDGTYIPAPQTVSSSFQQPAVGTTVPDASLQSVPFVEAGQTSAETTVQVLPGQSPAAGSQFGESTPTAVVYQTPSQPQYQAPVTPPFISQSVTAAVTASPTTVSYVTTPAQQAAQFVQTQPVQQVYYTTPQGQVIVQQQPVVFQGQAQVVAVADVAQGPRDPREPPPPPPSPPPRARKRRLPPNWKTARDSEGKIYYYHAVTRQTQWDPPAWEGEQDDDMDLGTPTHDEPKSKKKTTTAAADTSTETAKRIKDHFRAKMSKLIVSYLNPYRRPDCKAGRITSTDDFKHLARKLTHTVLEKELKHCRHLEDLEVNENVKAKTKDYIKKYMSRFGPTYKKATTSP